MARCPICAKDVRPRTENKAFPFCSPRCKQVDLGKWLNEEYRVPVEGSQTEDGETAQGNGAPASNGHHHKEQ